MKAMKTKIILIFLIIAALSMGCAQKIQKVKTNKPVNQPEIPPATNKIKQNNLTEIEQNLNNTIENVDQLLSQLNEIENITFNV